MKGKYSIIVRDRKLKYEIEIKRKFTIIRGNSATGKTTLAGLVTLYRRRGLSSGVSITSSVPVDLLSDNNWEFELQKEGYVFIVDEDVADLVCLTEEFAKASKYSNNYFIIITRSSMPMIPYSVSEIYTICASSPGVKKGYTINTLVPKYRDVDFGGIPDLVIVEDSKSGYEFFSKTLSCDCISSNGNSSIISLLDSCVKSRKYSCIFCIVDGSAFGSFIDSLFSISQGNIDCTVGILAPESFEWLILRSGLENIDSKYLDETYNYCDTGEYSHWEPFYEDLLKEVSKIRTKGYGTYSKNKSLDTRYITNSKQIYDILYDLDLARR